MSHDSWFPAQRFEELAWGFHIEPVGDARGVDPLLCTDVRGFDEARVAAHDPLATAPSRLVIVDAAVEDDRTQAWLDGWSEDTDRVRRSFAIRRVRDGAQIVIVATLASHGFGVPTSLAVESIRAREGGDILRSGVHLKIDVERALAHDEGWGAHEPG